MKFTKWVTSVFYTDLSVGLKLFVDCLKFTIEHKDLNASQPYYPLKKEEISILVFQDERLAKEHNPELRLVTDTIDEVFEKVVSTPPHLLHPNLDKVTIRPWGAKEFAIADQQLGMRFQQW